MDKVCIYLRKSRADEELEKTLGEGETLKKHRIALLKYAKEKNLNIVDIKEELVSGDSLFFRPEMLTLLKEVQEGKYSGVLVMDIDRLGRGDMKDQGIILEAFKESKTKIITPSKTYDLDDEYDEEMTEFKTFFARRELKSITRRMQGGRIRSVQNGNYIGSTAPYGYDITFINKDRTLKPNETESAAVKIMFDMYINGCGSGEIAEQLNKLGYKTKTGKEFERTSVLFIIKNPIYIGKVTWKKKEIKKSKKPGKVKDTRTRDISEWIIADGKHPSIIEEDTFNRAQEILKGKYHIPYQIVNGPTNPLAGVVICGACGEKMVARPNPSGLRIICKNNKCKNISSRFDLVEKSIIKALDEYLNGYRINIKAQPKISDFGAYESQIKVLEKELLTLNDQKLKLFDFLERGIYSEDTFLERSKNIEARIEQTILQIKENKGKIKNLKQEINKEDLIIFQKLLDAYIKTEDVKKKNEMIKALIFKAEYTKNKKGNNFDIQLFPRLKPTQ